MSDANTTNANTPFNLRPLVNNLIDSKSKFDALPRTLEMRDLLSVLVVERVYSTDRFAEIMTFVTQPRTAIQLFTTSPFSALFHLHSSILTLEAVSEKLLVGDPKVNEYERKASDVTVFQITDLTTTLTLAEFSKILKLLAELVDILAFVYTPGKELAKPEILLLDSGSPASVALKTSLEIAEALFKVFKEVWDYSLNHKHYKAKIEMGSLIENITVLKTIKEAETQGTLSPEKAKEYSALVIRKTDDLIGLRVLPKQIVDVELVQKNVDLLQGFDSIKLLRFPFEEETNPPETPENPPQTS